MWFKRVDQAVAFSPDITSVVRPFRGMIGDVKIDLGGRFSAGASPHVTVIKPPNHRPGSPAEDRNSRS
jgi:hypothetical protein